MSHFNTLGETGNGHRRCYRASANFHLVLVIPPFNGKSEGSQSCREVKNICRNIHIGMQQRPSAMSANFCHLLLPEAKVNWMRPKLIFPLCKQMVGGDLSISILTAGKSALEVKRFGFF